MSPETSELLRTVLTDGIKILGPAVIAAYATYRSASLQFESKLKELDKSHQFQAREKIYSHLKERLAHIDQQTDKLNGELGRILGFTAGYTGGGSSPASDEVIDLMSQLVNTFSKMAPMDISNILREMELKHLAEAEEFSILSERQAQIRDLPLVTKYEELKDTLFLLIETYNLLGVAARKILQQEMEQVLQSYMES